MLDSVILCAVGVERVAPGGSTYFQQVSSPLLNHPRIYTTQHVPHAHVPSPTVLCVCTVNLSSSRLLQAVSTTRLRVYYYYHYVHWCYNLCNTSVRLGIVGLLGATSQHPTQRMKACSESSMHELISSYPRALPATCLAAWRDARQSRN